MLAVPVLAAIDVASDMVKRLASVLPRSTPPVVRSQKKAQVNKPRRR
jgi:hypothetical protein